jgi:hypothetical protein
MPYPDSKPRKYPYGAIPEHRKLGEREVIEYDLD